MSISKSKLWIAGGSALCVLLLVATWFLLIVPKRAEAKDLRTQTSTAESSNEQLKAKIEQLKELSKQLPAKRADLAKIRQAMPADVGEATLLREISAIAKETGVTVVSVTPADPMPLTKAAVTAPAATDEEGSSTAKPTAAATANAAGAQVLAVPVTIVSDGTFAGSQAFLRKLQDKMPRAFLVTNLIIQARKPGDTGSGKPVAVNGDVEITIKGDVFVLDAPEIDADGTVTPTKPASVPTTSSTTNSN